APFRGVGKRSSLGPFRRASGRVLPRIGTSASVAAGATDCTFRRRVRTRFRPSPTYDRWIGKPMKTLRALLVLTSVIATACGDDGEPLTKGRVDVVALANSATVTLSGATGSITVPFATPVPNVPNDDLEEELSGAVALTVSSPRTQVSFN